MTGTVRSLDQRGFGFIDGDDGQERFFPARELHGVTFQSLRPGQRVTFDPRPGWASKGPRAHRVGLLTDQVAA